MKALVRKITKLMFAQDNLKYFKVLVIIGIVGFNIDPSCFMFIEHFSKINACMCYTCWSGVKYCLTCIYK